VWLAFVETQIHVDTGFSECRGRHEGRQKRDPRDARRNATVTDGVHEQTSDRNRQSGVAVPVTLVAARASVRTIE
jgi:RES domain-containing protein